MNGKKTVLRGYAMVALLFICILANYGGRELASALSLPIWLDSYGTFFAAYAAGPIPGAIVGAAANFLFFMWHGISFTYALVSVFIGVSVGLLVRRGYLETFFKSMTVGGTAAIGSMVISSVLNLIFSGGSTNNIWGDGVINYMAENGIPRNFSVFIGQLYLEFPDKLLTVILLFLSIRLVRHFRNSGADKTAKEAAAAVTALMLLFAAVPLSEIHAEAADTERVSYIQTVYNGENSLPPGHANAVVQTNDGILWIGTYAGLYRYNGKEFRHMNDFAEIKNVNCLFVDDEGRLWVGTNDNGVAIIINDAVANVINTGDGLPSDSIRSITQNSAGEYYIGTSDGIAALELKIGITLTAVLPEVGYVGRQSSDSIGNTAAVNSEGDLYIISGGKITAKLSPPEDSGKFSCCTFSEDGTLMVGTTDSAVLKCRLEDGEVKVEKSVVCGGMTKINQITFHPDGTIWLCSDKGIGFLDKSLRFTKQESNSFNHSIENMTSDYQGNLWFASSRLGLLRLSRSAVTDVFADSGIEGSIVNSTAIYNGLLYSGTDDGLTVLDLSTHTSITNDLTKLLKGARIRCLMPDSAGNLWVCSYGAGLICYNSRGVITRYSETVPDMGTRVRVCTELSDGTIAVGCSTGVYFIKDAVLVGSIPFSDDFGYAQALCFLEDNGTLYAGTDGNGIVKITRNSINGRITRSEGLTSEVILRMVKDPEDGSIYIVTSNSLCRLENGSVRVLKAFPYSNSYDVIIHGDKVFVPGSAGVYVVDKQELLSGSLSSYTLLDSKTGLIGSLTANAFNAIDEKDCVYLSTDRGAFTIDLNNYLLHSKAFRLMVSEVRLDDKPQRIDRMTDLSIDRTVTKIEFVPEIINYTHENPTVSYMLEGFDSDWTNVPQSELLSVVYTNLEPGDYTFRLAVRDSAGSILEENIYRLRKDRAIQDNMWFRFYMIGVGGLFIGWLTWFVSRRRLEHTLQLQQAKLQLALTQAQMANETILAIAKTVDAKDFRTSKHSQRVSEYSALIAKEYGFTPDECENLRKAALLHDIGKIAIPDNVLNKPARLTDEEYAKMKTHVTRGAEILKDVTMIDHVVEGARYHHERYDGRGYPDGLKGEEIPLYGRIIAIADAFDAMTANRVYRKKQDIGYVLGELHKNRGTQFDPELLDIFLKLLDDKVIDIDSLYKDIVPEEDPNAKPAEKAEDKSEAKPAEKSEDKPPEEKTAESGRKEG